VHLILVHELVLGSSHISEFVALSVIDQIIQCGCTACK